LNFVIDASVAGKWLLPEADSDKAEAMLVRWQEGSVELLAPEIIYPEVANMLWKRTARGLLSGDEVHKLYARFVQIDIPLAPMMDLVGSALEVALEHGRSVYDALYVALSLGMGWDFVTADERLHNALGSWFPQVRLLRDWS
jgi:predicted nucleic acid-binding protein